MREFPRGVLCSDLDGTFLDRQYRPAVDAAALRTVTAAWRVVWVSSRTASELLALQHALEHREDAIGENGGVLLTFDHATATRFGTPTPLDDAYVVTLATPIAVTRDRVREALAAAGATATDVSSLAPEALAARSGYGLDDAQRALDRRTSVLLADLSANADAALDALRVTGHTVVHGGRWTSILHGSDKGRALQRWLAAQAPDLTTVGVGDADNDVALLAAVHHPYVINDEHHGPSPRLAAIPRAHVLTAPGTAGWRELLTRLSSLVPAE